MSLYDPAAAAAALSASDRRLKRLIDRVGPPTIRIEPAQTLFAALARSIVYQQLSGRAAGTIHGRVLALFPRRRITPAGLLALRTEQLRGAGLSAAKAAALQDLAVKTLDGTVPTLPQVRRLSDDELVERLTQVRGVGRWTVEMLLIFRLGRPDVLPVTDLGVRKGFAVTYRLEELPDPDEMIERAERWRPWRSIGSWYMWRAAEGG
jgi:3-methyladenine DNA glycosylase/8-oxoguanine DNA glycosylase